MRVASFCKFLLASAGVFSVAACGGGGGGGTTFIPSPPVTPAPPPTSTPSSSTPAPFGLTASRQFATFGVLSPPDAGRYNVATADPNAISFSWSAEANAYQITLPGFAPAQLALTFPGNNPLAFHATDANGNRLPLAISVWTPDVVGLNLSYSSLAHYSTYPEGATDPYISGSFAFGVPTAVGDVPTTGTANYDAKVFGRTLGIGYDITGDARLTFDFGAGSLSGYMRPRLFSDWDGVDRALGQYDFTQTVYSSGSTTFAGRFVVPNGPNGTDSTFQGQFTGPNAAELIAGWRAPYFDPFDNVWKSMGGVWLGKKQ